MIRLASTFLHRSIYMYTLRCNIYWKRITVNALHTHTQLLVGAIGWKPMAKSRPVIDRLGHTSGVEYLFHSFERGDIWFDFFLFLLFSFHKEKLIFLIHIIYFSPSSTRRVTRWNGTWKTSHNSRHHHRFAPRQPYVALNRLTCCLPSNQPVIWLLTRSIHPCGPGLSNRSQWIQTRILMTDANSYVLTSTKSLFGMDFLFFFFFGVNLISASVPCDRFHIADEAHHSILYIFGCCLYLTFE